MALLLAVDPGVVNAGVAFFCNGILVDAWLTESLFWKETAGDIRDELVRRHVRHYDFSENMKVVVEVPQIYVGARQKGRQKDLVDVAVMAGMLLGLMTGFTDDLVMVQPAGWKGQLPKKVVEARVKERLSRTEQLRIRLPKEKSLHHNVHDAVGLGLWALKKL